MSAQKKKLMLVINPVAGKREAAKKLAELVEVFYAGGYLSTVFITGRSGDATEFAMKYADDFDLVVCSGGDGTMNEIVTGLDAMAVPFDYVLRRPPFSCVEIHVVGEPLPISVWGYSDEQEGT